VALLRPDRFCPVPVGRAYRQTSASLARLPGPLACPPTGQRRHEFPPVCGRGLVYTVFRAGLADLSGDSRRQASPSGSPRRTCLSQSQSGTDGRGPNPRVEFIRAQVSPYLRNLPGPDHGNGSRRSHPGPERCRHQDAWDSLNRPSGRQAPVQGLPE